MKSKKSPTDENIKTYKDYRNRLTMIIRNTEINYYGNQLELNKDDMNKSWNIIRDIIGLNNNSINNNYIKHNDVIISIRVYILIYYSTDTHN